MVRGESYYYQINGGWRQVQFIGFDVGSLVHVRDEHRGELLRVNCRDLVPVVPRKEWEGE